jgi:nucleoside-diphosphate-sugar epimerase
VKLMQSGEIYPVNLGNPRETNMLAFAGLIQQLTGSTAGIVHRPLPEDDPRQRRPDISKAERILGWSPSVSLEDGLRRTVSYFQSIDPALGCSQALSTVSNVVFA